MTYEDQLGGLAGRITEVREQVTAAYQRAIADAHDRIDDTHKGLDEMAVALSNHMSSTFNLVNEARDAVRAVEQRLALLERMVLGGPSLSFAQPQEAAPYDAGNQAQGGDVPLQNTAGGGSDPTGDAGDGEPVSGSAGSSVGTGGSESQGSEGAQGTEDQSGQAQS